MADRNHHELEEIAKSVTDWRRISDHLFRVGPLKVGLDGILTWIPGVGDAYGLGASAFLLVQAARAGASNETLVKMGLLLGTDAVVGSVPVIGDAFDMIFRAHARSARVLTDDIRKRQAALPAPRRPTEPPPRAEAPRSEPPPPPPPPTLDHSEADEWEQARRVEALRAEVQARGGSIVRPRP
jgi:hypothetical protein